MDNTGAKAPARPESDSMKLLKQAQIDLATTEENGVATLATLADNRTTLEKIRANLHLTDATLDTARGFIRSITQRDSIARIFLIVFAIVLLALVVAGIAYLIEKNTHN